MAERLEVAAAGLRAFVKESNRIEGITRAPTKGEIAAHRFVLEVRELTLDDLRLFVRQVAGAELREYSGMNVRVGAHRPLPGGPQVRLDLEQLLAHVAHPYIASEMTPHEAHVEYEMLHPFLDGNGRSGRVLWAWMMQRENLAPFALPFLHRFYYQTLDAARPTQAQADSAEAHNPEVPADRIRHG